MLKKVSLNIALALIIFQASLEARANSPEECDIYAKKAVAQAEISAQFGCGGTGPRYSQEYAVHYNWCLAVPGQAAYNENRARVVELSNCNSTNWNREADRYCTWYSGVAVNQAAFADRDGCGFSGPRWDKRLALHYRWCMGVPGAWPESEMNARQEQLNKCTNGSVVYPGPSGAFSGDLTAVDWCWEMTPSDTFLNVVIQNVGQNTWTSRKDLTLIVGTHTGGTIRELKRQVPFTELFGMVYGQKVTIRGTTLKYTTPYTNPVAEIVLTHPEDINAANDRNLKISFGTSGVSDFYTKYASKRCNLFE